MAMLASARDGFNGEGFVAVHEESALGRDVDAALKDAALGDGTAELDGGIRFDVDLDGVLRRALDDGFICSGARKI